MRNNENYVYTCPTLEKHINSLYKKIGPMPKEFGFTDRFNWLNNRVNQIQSLNLYDGFENELAKSYSMNTKLANEVVVQLERYAVLYFTNYDIKFMRQSDIFHLDQLKKLSQLSGKILRELERTDNEFFQFLDFINFYEDKEEREPSISEFFEDIIEKLQLLQSLPSKIPDTKIGKGIGIGSRSRKDNPALLQWSSLMLELWFKMGRGLAEDKNKIRGRKQLIDFMWDSLQRIHPEVEHHTLDYIIRRLQKQHKEQ